MQYQECESCAAKPGSPELCNGCFNNRTYISNLERELAFFQKIVKALIKD